MPSPSETQLDVVFTALGDPTRRALLASLSRSEQTVSQLAEPFDMTLAAVSKHLKVLERAGLVARTIEGRVHTLRLEAEPLSEANRWIAAYQRFWGASLDSLGEFLKEDA
ncbi:Transcriptional repressor SdpR [Pseudobythopirellula maris]|uniref:Transcriptional repressor SdpR n=1 Tax=Pseudobythopirellula maris TaxID=2527991 RepID=A0A5C5ZU97_9BACT|nr:metalloregulator ArsR/SmtB family transcription factor [Pseudobythopirellula maris]TWT90810.1 Transcriptional repressor SdpR [Pseudobythopirellula maris]